jgi:hypothetical protein
MTYPTIVVLVQNSHDLANLQFELVIHGWLELELNAVNGVTRTAVSRSGTYDGDNRSHTDLSLSLDTRSCRRAEIKAGGSGTRYGAALKLDRRTERTLFGDR